MSHVHEILSVIGWAWLLVFLVVIPVRLMLLKKREQRRGFDVIPAGEPKHGSTRGGEAK